MKKQEERLEGLHHRGTEITEKRPESGRYNDLPSVASVLSLVINQFSAPGSEPALLKIERLAAKSGAARWSYGRLTNAIRSAFTPPVAGRRWLG